MSEWKEIAVGIGLIIGGIVTGFVRGKKNVRDDNGETKVNTRSYPSDSCPIHGERIATLEGECLSLGRSIDQLREQQRTVASELSAMNRTLGEVLGKISR